MKPPLTLNETKEGLVDKKFSAVQLVDAYLAQINKYNNTYNIYLTLTEELAYKKAKETDRLIAKLGEQAFHDHPFLGATIGFKDIFLTKDIRTTAASKVLENYVPPYSATSVKRFEAAGVIPLGKLNCDAWAHGSSGENSDFGNTLNPWDKDYTPGGSSSGSGAALAANMALLATATDTCGSVRLPANYCYLVGLKPTYGAISRYGVIAMASSLDTVALLGHSVDDVQIMFDVVKGEDGYDGTVKNFQKAERKSKYTIGVPREFFVDGLDEEIQKTIYNATSVFKKAKVEVKEVSLPSTIYAVSVYYIIQPAEVSSNLGRFDGIRYGNTRDAFGEEAKRRIMIGSYVLSSGYYDAYYHKAMKVRSIIISEVDKVFKDVDALIAPVAPTPPFKLGEKVDDPVKMYLTDIYAATANLCGIPSIALPSGFSSKELPLGFQLMGPRFSEYDLFILGNIYHKEIGYEPKVAI